MRQHTVFITALLLTVTAHLSITCPSQCQSCASGRVRCPGVGLTKVPSAFPQDTISVDLTQNNIQELDALPSLADLQSFRMSMNKLDVIKGGVFENTPNLMSLDLSMNTIKKVYKHGFKELSQLMTISLNGNQLKEVGLIFQNTPMITSVRLGNNEIAEIDDEAFKNNTMIKMIDLSNNQISRIHSNAFKNLDMLRILLLSNNPLTTLSDLTFSTPMLSLADFTDCRLTSVPRVMPPEVGDFRLGQNNLTRITLEDFQNITSLTLLTMNDNKINFVEHRSFEGLEDLKELWMSRNELVYIPRGLPKTLQKLYMDSNQVVELEQMLFKPDSALNVLNLEGNKVFKIHSEALKDAPQLTTLNLQGNAITMIESGTFTHSPNLESLTFTNNPIDVFKSGAFKNLGMLTEISLSYIDSKTTDVENLLPDFFFQEMLNVTEIDLMSSVKLTRAFLDKIKDGTAQPFTEVKLLNLQYNELKTLPQNIRSVFPNIKQLLLDGNMLVCDKNLLWLYDWMKTTEVSFHQYDLPTCDLPKSLYGQVIATLSRGDFVDTVDNIQETRNEQKPQNPPQQETAPVDPIQQASNQGNDITPPSTANNSPQPTNRNPEPAVTRSTGMAGTRVIIRPPKVDRTQDQPQVQTDKSPAKASYSELARKAARKAEKERKKGEQFERRRSRRERNERNKNENDKRSEKRKIRNKKEKQGRKCEKDENGNIIKCARKQRDKKKCEVLADGTVRCKKSRGNKDKTIATPEAQRA